MTYSTVVHGTTRTKLRHVILAAKDHNTVLTAAFLHILNRFVIFMRLRTTLYQKRV